MDELRLAIEQHLGGLSEFAHRHLVVEETAADGERVLHVQVRARDAAESLLALFNDVAAGIPGASEEVAYLREDLHLTPEVIRGITVHVSRRLVQRIEVDLLEVARSSYLLEDGIDASFRITLALFDHGRTEAIQKPDDAFVLTGDDFRELIDPFTFSSSLPPSRSLATQPV